MNISAEIRERLKLDQVASRRVLSYLTEHYEETFESLAKQMNTDSQTVMSWFLEETEIGRETCWKILELGEKFFVPLEPLIRADILAEYDPPLIVILGREYIKLAYQRFLEDASEAETYGKRLCLVVPNASFTFAEIGSTPGSTKVGLSLSILQDKLRSSIYRIDDQERLIGGDVPFLLPLNPEALNADTLKVYMPHADHNMNYRDYLEVIRIIKTGEVVANGYLEECFDRRYLTRINAQ